jgi:hypothetical protein
MSERAGVWETVVDAGQARGRGFDDRAGEAALGTLWAYSHVLDWDVFMRARLVAVSAQCAWLARVECESNPRDYLNKVVEAAELLDDLRVAIIERGDELGGGVKENE